MGFALLRIVPFSVNGFLAHGLLRLRMLFVTGVNEWFYALCAKLGSFHFR